MASVIDETDCRTPACKLLDAALGRERVNFGELSEAEANERLCSVLNTIDLRELRGFKPVRELLVFRPISVRQGLAARRTLSVETLEFSNSVTFDGDAETGPDTHAMRLCFNHDRSHETFKRNESQEETTDRVMAVSWGCSAYHQRGYVEMLALRRPRNHKPADENLFVICYSYEKVHLEERHVITSVRLSSLPLDGLRHYFGEKYAYAMVEMVRGFDKACGNTVSALQNQLAEAQRTAEAVERLRDSIWY